MTPNQTYVPAKGSLPAKLMPLPGFAILGTVPTPLCNLQATAGPPLFGGFSPYMETIWALLNPHQSLKLMYNLDQLQAMVPAATNKN